MWYYLAAISMISFVVCVYDKYAASRKIHRVPEATLLALSFVGGATVMYLTMQLIRHKTKHLKFMALLPIMIVLHLVLLICFGKDFNYWL